MYTKNRWMLLAAFVAAGMIGIGQAHAGDSVPDLVKQNAKKTARTAGAVADGNLANAKANWPTSAPGNVSLTPATPQSVAVANPQVGQIVEMDGKQYMLQEQNGQLVAVPFSAPVQQMAQAAVVQPTGPAMANPEVVDNHVNTAGSVSTLNQQALADNSAANWAKVDETESKVANLRTVTSGAAGVVGDFAAMGEAANYGKVQWQGVFGGKNSTQRAGEWARFGPGGALFRGGPRHTTTVVRHAPPVVTTRVVHVCNHRCRLVGCSQR